MGFRVKFIKNSSDQLFKKEIKIENLTGSKLRKSLFHYENMSKNIIKNDIINLPTKYLTKIFDSP